MHYSLQQKIGEEIDRLQWLILNHNLETFNSLYNYIRPKADYNMSIQLIRDVKKINPNTITKSGIMLGLGEKENYIKL